MDKRFLTALLLLGLTTTAFAQEMREPVLLKAGGNNIDVARTYAAPAIVDYDNDGKDDLVIGTYKGNFRFYKNVGSESKPVYNGFKRIQANGKDAVAPNW